MGKINFFTESISFKIPAPRKTVSWLNNVIRNENSQLIQLNYIFCSDEHLHKINIEYLNHKTLTDIITFDNSDGDGIEGDIFISVDRVRDNAKRFNVDFEIELRRVLVHGALHLLGYKDKSAREQLVMRKKEDTYLSLWA